MILIDLMSIIIWIGKVRIKRGRNSGMMVRIEVLMVEIIGMMIIRDGIME